MTNGEKRRRYLSVFLIGLAIIGIISSIIMLWVGYVRSVQNMPHPVLPRHDAEQRVLFISSYSETFDTMNAQLTGIYGVFEKNDVICDTEYMDMKNYDTAENVDLFYTTLKYKLSHHQKYDVILLGDDAALEFALQHQDDLFPQTPLVFFGINDTDRARQAAANPFITGSVENFNFAQILDIATKLIPNAKSIIAVYDNTASGLGDEKQFFALQERYPSLTFTALNTADYTRIELGNKIGQLGNDTILICLSAYTDKDNFYHTILETAQFFYSNAKIPVFSKLFDSVGKGFLGGYLFDWEEAGRYSAQVVVQLLNGKDIADFPLKEDLPSHFYFDDAQMKHFKLDSRLLPEGTILTNRKPSFWKHYALVLIPFITITISLCILLMLVYSYARQLRLSHNLDGLTRLPNRDVAHNTVRRLIKNKTDFSVILLDIEGLKTLNDFYTSACGDYILRELAVRLTSIKDLGDYMVARYGGDEFVMVWKGNHLDKNSTVLFLLKQAITAPFDYNDNQIFIKASMGIANYTGKDDTTVDEYFSNADSAMAEAKKVGKNKSVFFTTEMREAMQTKQEIAKILENACNRDDGFYVLYQPQIDVATGEIHGYEALCRLKTVKIFPGQFIPVAEESGLMAKIGRIVTEQVIKQMVEWRKKGFPLRKVSINYSAAQMADKEYISYLKSLLDKNDISPSLIEIEITESLFMGNRKLAAELAADFRSIGIQLALDDFGTGYSSLSYLTYIPVEIIKLDKTLVDAYLQEGKESFIENIINLVHGLNMRLIIEGVEQKWQYDMLKKLKGDIIQGYYFSKPIPAKEVETFKPIVV